MISILPFHIKIPCRKSCKGRKFRGTTLIPARWTDRLSLARNERETMSPIEQLQSYGSVFQEHDSGGKFNHNLNLTGLSAGDPVSLLENHDLWAVCPHLLRLSLFCYSIALFTVTQTPALCQEGIQRLRKKQNSKIAKKPVCRYIHCTQALGSLRRMQPSAGIPYF